MATGYWCSALWAALHGQQRAVWFVGRSSAVSGHLPIWQATTLIEENQSKSTQGADLHFSYQWWKDWTIVKRPYSWVFTDSQAGANGLAIWSGRRAVTLGSYINAGLGIYREGKPTFFDIDSLKKTMLVSCQRHKTTDQSNKVPTSRIFI